MKLAIVILNWNGQQLLEIFLPSVVRYSEKHDVYVIDNGSTDTSVAFLKAHYPSIKCVKLTHNMGYAGGYNAGLKLIDADVFCLLNSDVEVTKNWLKPIIEAFRTNPNTAIIQPKILDYHNKNKFEYAGAGGGFIDQLGYPYCRGRIFDTIEEESNTSESAKKQETEGQSLQENVEEIIDDSSSIAEDSGTEDLISDETVTKAGTSESFLERLQLDDDSVASRFSAGKLETLIGAFGLNQRLRYINDLFDGSSEMFSEAIKMLDSQTALDVANEKAAQLAVQHSWDPEEEVVVEFMSFVSN